MSSTAASWGDCRSFTFFVSWCQVETHTGVRGYGIIAGQRAPKPGEWQAWRICQTACRLFPLCDCRFRVYVGRFVKEHDTASPRASIGGERGGRVPNFQPEGDSIPLGCSLLDTYRLRRNQRIPALCVIWSQLSDEKFIFYFYTGTLVTSAPCHAMNQASRYGSKIYPPNAQWLRRAMAPIQMHVAKITILNCIP